MTTEELAEIMHDKLCRWNHTDGCPWLYEQDYSTKHPDVDVWDQYVHRNFLESAKKLVEKLEGEVDRETIIKVIKAL
jgi:hypothetical protein